MKDEPENPNVRKLDDRRTVNRLVTLGEVSEIAELLNSAVVSVLEKEKREAEIKEIVARIGEMGVGAENKSIFETLENINLITSTIAARENASIPEKRVAVGLKELVAALAVTPKDQTTQDTVEFLRARLETIQWYATRKDGHTK